MSLLRERQQQLDELSKELQRVQEESELLKMRIKAMSNKNNTSGSKNVNVALCIYYCIQYTMYS